MMDGDGDDGRAGEGGRRGTHTHTHARARAHPHRGEGGLGAGARGDWMSRLLRAGEMSNDAGGEEGGLAKVSTERPRRGRH